MINIFNLPSIYDEPEAQVTEVDLEKEKRDRIAFHRRSVRNGPVSYKIPTPGQERREAKRGLRRRSRAARRHEVRKHLDERYEQAVIRAHLQHAGVLEYGTPKRKIDPQLALASITWIVERFADDRHADDRGRVEVTIQVVQESLTSALNRWQTIVGLPTTSLSPAYVLPVALSYGDTYEESLS